MIVRFGLLTMGTGTYYKAEAKQMELPIWGGSISKSQHETIFSGYRL